MEKSDKSFLAVVLLAFFLGSLGLHRFYVGKIGSGIAQALMFIIGSLTVIIIIGFVPLFVLGIWVLIDFITILVGNFTDSEGRTIRN